MGKFLSIVAAVSVFVGVPCTADEAKPNQDSDGIVLGYMIEAKPESVAIKTIRLPEIEKSQEPYSLFLWENGERKFFRKAIPGELVEFPAGGTRKVEVAGINAELKRCPIETFNIALTFVEDGRFIGAETPITAVPYVKCGLSKKQKEESKHADKYISVLAPILLIPFMFFVALYAIVTDGKVMGCIAIGAVLFALYFICRQIFRSIAWKESSATTKKLFFLGVIVAIAIFFPLLSKFFSFLINDFKMRP